MTARRWIFTVFTVLAAAVAFCAGLAYAIDPYGLWRDSSGRPLRIYFQDAKAKLLMCDRYVPTNFDALIVGPSSGEPLSFDRMHGYRIYNLSIGGANAAESQILVDRALSRGHYKLAFVVIQEQMTLGHELRAELAETRPGESAISIHAFINEAGTLLASRGVMLRRNPVSPNGQYIFARERGQIGVGPIGPLGAAYFQPDPVAVRDLSDMVRSLMASGTKVVYVQLPVYRGLYESNRSDFERYTALMRSELPAAPFVDFDDPRYEAISGDPDNFSNAKHLNQVGARKVEQALDRAIPQLL